MVLYTIDGVALKDPGGRWWVTAEGSSARQGLRVRSVDAAVPGLDGILAPVRRERRDAAPLNLRIMCPSRDPLTRETAWDDVMGLFASSTTVIVGRKVTISDPGRTAVAKLTSVSEPELTAKAGALVGVVGLSILDGLFHSATTDVTWSLGSTISERITGLAGSAPVDDWKIRCRGPLTSIRVTDTATGTGISWAGSVASNRWLHITGAAARVATTSTAWNVGGSDASGGISLHPAGLLSLTPTRQGGVRSTEWQVESTGADTASEITLRAGAAWV
ncbi:MULTISPECIES: hypothetical protein [unclassified Microbacterium]|uniref:hypothetical protein n=1 Tax=unclassified Microbacterium TaxID=2609290 RepID=UPI0030192CA0